MKTPAVMFIAILAIASLAPAIPNPAAQFCVQCGYRSEIRTDPQGGQYGVCVFPDGSECDEWDYFRKCHLAQCGDCNCPWPCPKRIIYVDDDANGLNDGSSWQNAYKFLQDALTDANSSPKPVEIRVAQGIYKPDDFALSDRPNLGRAETFQLKNGVAIRGGYAGIGAPDPNARDIQLYKTILSGDLNGNDINISRPIDLIREPSRDENSYHVVTGSGTDATGILDGFTIVGGNASADSSSTHSMGAGVYNTSGRPTINNCMFIWNFASRGGAGMYNSESNPTITGCSFGQKVVYNKGDYVVNGAGMYNEESSPIVTNCLFIENVAYSGYQPYRWVNGGGIYNQQSSPTIVNCTFTRNETWYGYGGGVYNFCYSNPVIIDCTFTDGHGEWGGGIACNENSSPIIKNCTISGNLTYQEGGGIYCGASSNPIITNSIIVGNETEEADGSGIACFGGSAPVITYSDIQGGWTGEGNIEVDPCFADVAKGDYHLKSQAGRWDPNTQSWVKDSVTSPCIDAGDPASPIGLEPFPNGGIINMGAYGGTEEASKSYFGEPVCETIVAGDINGDCKVDLWDLALMTSHWLEEH